MQKQWATQSQLKYIKRLLLDKFQINSLKPYNYLLIVNRDEVYKLRLNSDKYIDGNYIDKMKASGIISTLLDNDHSLINNKWADPFMVDENNELVTYMQLI